MAVDPGRAGSGRDRRLRDRPAIQTWYGAHTRHHRNMKQHRLTSTAAGLGLAVAAATTFLAPSVLAQPDGSEPAVTDEDTPTADEVEAEDQRTFSQRAWLA